MPRAPGLGVHLSWMARNFGRPEFAPLAPHDVEALAEALEAVEVPAGTWILVPGKPVDAAYVIETGEVELWLGRSLRRALVSIQRAGGVFGDIPMLCEMPFPYTAVAHTDVVLLKLGKDELPELLARHPHVALRWLTSLVKRLEYAHRRIASLTVGDLRSRVLALVAEELTGGSTTVALTQAQIAALLDASRQSVNRVLRELAEEGLVRVQYGGIEVVDSGRVLELVGLDFHDRC